MTNSLSLLAGGHGLLYWLSGLFNMPYSVKPWCIGTFSDHVELKYSLDDGSDDGTINQTKLKVICYKCTLRGASAQPLPRRESLSSRLVLT